MKRPVALATGAAQRELAQASALATTLLATAQRAAPERDALRYFDRLELPAALLAGDDIVYANAAWRDAFGTTVAPSWAQAGARAVLHSRATLHMPRVEADVRGHAVWLAAMFTASADRRAIVVCAELDDTAIATEPSAGMDVLVWSGAAGSSTTADYVNASWRAYVGDAGRTWREAIATDDLDNWDAVSDDIARRQGSAEVVVRLRRADGRERWHRVKIAFTSPGRWVAVAIDEHEMRVLRADRIQLLERLRVARIEAEQATRLKDQALAAVSHELRAPVMTMMLWERVLRDANTDAAARQQALDAIHQSAVAQSRLVADLLDVSRAISGKLYLDIRPVELDRVVSDSVEAALPVARGKGLQLGHRAAAGIAEVLGDASRLRQVLDNVIANAIKFTDPGGRIEVTTQRKGRVVAVTIEDNGRGIATTMLERIFDAFDQGEDTLARREGGLGLGLAIARQIAELHHGTMTAWSAGLGRGAKFTLLLPSAGQLRAPAVPDGMSRARTLSSVRVLVVDDDDRVRTALSMLLRRAGAQVAGADSAATARVEIATTDPQVIICDIGMPDEDGYTFIRKLRETGTNIPAIALTAYASRADATNALAAGFNLHVAKPVDFERLVASLSQLLDTNHA